jgi:hypothetical protein
MRRLLIIAAAILLGAILALGGGLRKLAVWTGVIKPGPDAKGASIVLPNGWRITPAGRHITLPGDMVMKIIASPDGKTVLASTAGWHDNSVSTIDLQSEKISATINVGKIWTGMALNPDTGAIFVSAGGPPTQQFLDSMKARGLASEVVDGLRLPVLRLQRNEDKLTMQRSLEITGLQDKERFIGGVTYAADHSLYVVNTQNDIAYRLSGPDYKTQVTQKPGKKPRALKSAAIRMIWDLRETVVCLSPTQDLTASASFATARCLRRLRLPLTQTLPSARLLLPWRSPLTEGGFMLLMPTTTTWR